MRHPSVSSEILHYYTETAEEDRLAGDRWQLEHVRTREILGRFLPPAPAAVVDVGGAGGVYALDLAAHGYAVRLLDAVPRLVGVARRRSASAQAPLAGCAVGDARALPWPSATADAALLLGPLYHLPEAEDRLAALHEIHRVLRPGGVAVMAVISRWASALDGLASDALRDPVFAAIVEEDLATGRHRNESRHPEYFTTAYFHRPEELTAEVEAAGLACEALLGVEGPAWLVGDFETRWGNPDQRAAMLRVARAVEAEPALLGVSAHWLAVATKGGKR